MQKTGVTSGLSIKQRLIVMVGLMSLMILIMGAYGLIGIIEADQKLVDGVNEARRLVTAVDTARLAEVNFKKQVQEWKNVLLRGQDPALYQKYLDAFTRQETLVQQNLQSLKPLMQQMGLPTDQVDGLVQSHQLLGTRYRQALGSYDQSSFQSAITVDKKVRGIDREPTDRMDALVRYIEEETEAGIKASESVSAEKLGRDQTYSQWAVALMAIAIGVGFFISTSIARDLERTA